jgi:hypothetical protein
MDSITEGMIQKLSSVFVVKVAALGFRMQLLIPLIDRKKGE